MKQTKRIAVFNFLAFLLMITVNLLANVLPLNGVNTGEVSGLYPSLFVPAAVTFTIWGLIYLLLFFSILIHLKAAFQYQDDPYDINSMSIYFILSCLLNSGWIIAWHYKKIILSVIIMAALFADLLILYKKMKIGSSIKIRYGKLMTDLPVSIYLGWICVAFMANVTALLVSLKWDAFHLPEEFWTGFLIAAVVLLGVVFTIKNRDVYFSGVFAWALLGIYMKQNDAYPHSVKSVMIESVCGIMFLLGIMLYQIIRKEIYHRCRRFNRTEGIYGLYKTKRGP